MAPDRLGAYFFLFFTPRRARRALLRAVPRLCAAFFFAFMRRPFSERACLYLGRDETFFLLRRPVAMGGVMRKPVRESKRAAL